MYVSVSSSVNHQEFFTVHTAMVYVYRFAESMRADLLTSCQQTELLDIEH